MRRFRARPCSSTGCSSPCSMVAACGVWRCAASTSGTWTWIGDCCMCARAKGARTGMCPWASCSVAGCAATWRRRTRRRSCSTASPREGRAAILTAVTPQRGAVGRTAGGQGAGIKRTSRCTPCGTPMPRTCWKTGWISSPSKNCWGRAHRDHDGVSARGKAWSQSALQSAGYALRSRAVRPACEVAQVIRQLGEQVERSKAAQPLAKAHAAPDPGLPHGSPGRSPGPVSGLFPPAHELQQLPEPPLPQVPGAGAGRLGGSPQGGAVAGAVLPRGVHPARELNRLCLYAPERVYDALFATAWSVIDSFAGDGVHLGARTGMIAILHTWGQNLSLHPHLHCIVPGGGISPAGYWKRARSKGRFLFPVKP